MQAPIVSIIIPTYNRAHIIGETLDSVLAQTYTNWECIVVDDGSTDNTDEILAIYCKKDIRFQYHHRPNNRPKGANACRNYGFELSKGEYINWLDSDDLFSNNKLRNQIELAKREKADVITIGWDKFNNSVDSCKVRITNQNKNFETGIELLKSFDSKSSFIPIHAYLMIREVIDKTNLWDTNITINQDGEFISRLMLVSQRIIFCDKGMVYYRVLNNESTSNILNKEKWEQSVITWRIIEERLLKLNVGEFNFIEAAKDYLFSKIQDKRMIADTYQSFFKKQLRAYRLKKWLNFFFK